MAISVTEVMAARFTVQVALDLIFRDEKADSDLEADVSEQEHGGKL